MDMVTATVTYESTLRRGYEVEVEDGDGWEQRAKLAARKRREAGDEADEWDETTPSVDVERQD